MCNLIREDFVDNGNMEALRARFDSVRGRL